MKPAGSSVMRWFLDRHERREMQKEKLHFQVIPNCAHLDWNESKTLANSR
jgi:hypothetical protein